MTKAAFEALEAVYPQVIAEMPDEFDSHQFILGLAQMYQQLYVQALVEYAGNDRPFEIVHGLLAKRLMNFPDLVKRSGVHVSKDIFQQDESASIWLKVNRTQ